MPMAIALEPLLGAAGGEPPRSELGALGPGAMDGVVGVGGGTKVEAGEETGTGAATGRGVGAAETLGGAPVVTGTAAGGLVGEEVEGGFTLAGVTTFPVIEMG